MSESKATYNAVVIPPTGDARIYSFDNVLDLVSALKPFYGTRTQVVPFKGTLWAISKGPVQRHLMSPDGSTWPLFPVEPIEADSAGFLHTDEPVKENHDRVT